MKGQFFRVISYKSFSPHKNSRPFIGFKCLLSPCFKTSSSDIIEVSSAPSFCISFCYNRGPVRAVNMNCNIKIWARNRGSKAIRRVWRQNFAKRSSSIAWSYLQGSLGRQFDSGRRRHVKKYYSEQCVTPRQVPRSLSNRLARKFFR